MKVRKTSDCHVTVVDQSCGLFGVYLLFASQQGEVKNLLVNKNRVKGVYQPLGI